MNRRDFTRWSAAIAAALAAQNSVTFAAATDPAAPDASHDAVMERYAAFMSGPKLTIGMMLYPGMFLQDLVGPLTVFEALMNREIHLLWKRRESVGNEANAPAPLIPVTATTSFADCPANLDVLFVPGGVPGTLTMMEDPEVLDFLRRSAGSARYVTSVCTGSLILGAAGLLRGYRATSHWATHDVLSELGAIPTHGRVVTDRNRITGGGVTAGIDFGLTIAATLRGELYAKATQLYLEYDPAPPFDAGSPTKAPPEANAFLDEMFVGLRANAKQTAIRAYRRLGERS